MNRRVVVLASGGLDSTVLLYDFLYAGYYVYILHCLYGSNHEQRETRALDDILANASQNADFSGEIVDRYDIDLGPTLPWIQEASALTSGEGAVPNADYNKDQIRKLIVPQRNLVMLSHAASLAMTIDLDVTIAYSAHAADHEIYPDCRPSFLYEFQHAVTTGSPRTFHHRVEAPFISEDKADIVKQGHKLDVPFTLTYSCYKGREKHCGVCPTCRERQRAFKEAGITDNTEYEE